MRRPLRKRYKNRRECWLSDVANYLTTGTSMEHLFWPTRRSGKPDSTRPTQSGRNCWHRKTREYTNWRSIPTNSPLFHPAKSHWHIFFSSKPDDYRWPFTHSSHPPLPQEQVRDVMFFLETQKQVEKMPNKSEIQQGEIVISAQPDSSSSSSTSTGSAKKGARKKRS